MTETGFWQLTNEQRRCFGIAPTSFAVGDNYPLARPVQRCAGRLSACKKERPLITGAPFAVSGGITWQP